MKFKLVESIEETDSEGNVLSPEQIEFFKNSKIRDRSGRLLVCYHGTGAEFDTFEKGDIGFHFGSAGQSASRAKYKGYDGAKNWVSIPCYLNILNPFEEEWDYGQWDWASIVETWFFGSGDEGEADYVYNGKEPAETYIPKEFQDESSMKVLHSLLNKYKEWRLQKRPRKMVEYNSEGNIALRNLFKAKGYDGISYVNAYEIAGGDDTAYIAFYPNQIKSITNKNPSSSDNMNEDLSPASIDEQTFKDAFSEPMNTLYGSKDMGMDVVCERLYYDYGIDATYHGATIYVGDKKLCTLRFSHEGRNLWGIYEIRTYIDGLKKVYTVHDFFE